MEASMLMLVLIIWIFLAAWAYEKNERILSLGLLAIGLGIVLVQNPLPMSDGLVYPLVAFVLLLIGIVVSGGVGLHRYMESRSP